MNCTCTCHRIPKTVACGDCYSKHPDSRLYKYFSEQHKPTGGKMHRFRSAALAVWYTLILNRFSMRTGYLFVTDRNVKASDSRNGVTRIPMREK